MLPEEEARKVQQGIAHLSASKWFVSQAGFDQVKTVFIFDAKDLPAGFQFDLDDFIVVEGEYYRVTEVDEYEFDSGWLIKTTLNVGADFRIVLEAVAESTLALSQGTTDVKETP